MPFNLLKTVQQNLGYPELKKVDPNTQDVIFDTPVSDQTRLGQAAIPAVLTGLYKYIETDEGLKRITAANESVNWLEAIFGDTGTEIINKIAAYSNCPFDTVIVKVHEIANESVRVIREHINAPGNVLKLRDFMSVQRLNILPYLPAALRTGELLKDSTLDDRTNKMSGPVSSFMHGMEGIFSPGNTSTKKENF
ncbi:MAG TPA: hypothetical protein VKC90_14175 [Chitinophagaceae bacterium]|nr:hypothetical protein [Chitinophagaceae bacterium]